MMISASQIYIKRNNNNNDWGNGFGDDDDAWLLRISWHMCELKIQMTQVRAIAGAFFSSFFFLFPFIDEFRIVFDANRMLRMCWNQFKRSNDNARMQFNPLHVCVSRPHVWRPAANKIDTCWMFWETLFIHSNEWVERIERKWTL